MTRIVLCMLWCGLTAPAVEDAAAQSGILRVRMGGEWREWWAPATAPVVWRTSHPLFAASGRWQRLQRGAEWAEVRVSGPGEAMRLRLVMVRLNPRAFRFELVRAHAAGRDEWTVDSAPGSAAVALNAGQFTDTGPWGWVVAGGVDVQLPGAGSLTVAIVFDTAGRVSWIEPDRIASVRNRGGITAAFQSYPVLLVRDGSVPDALRGERGGVDLRHRDSRLALGELRDGRLLIVLTRVDLPPPLDATPFGLTVPEMAAVMGALGARRAVLLDGGISAQLLLRDDAGAAREWKGWRSVPLGLVAIPRK